MKIRYLGHSCFECTDKNGVVLLTDPYTRVGYELPQGLRADIVTVSHGHFDHDYTEVVKDAKLLDVPFACVYKGISFSGVKCFHDEKHGALRGDNIIFKFVMDGLTVVHMGDIGEAVSQELVNRIGKVDVLLIPVGGTYTVDALGAKAYVDAISPKVVIPMHFKTVDGTIDIAEVQPFLRLFENGYTAVNEEIEITAETRGVIYMEKAKI